jgi:hypothetical protein
MSNTSGNESDGRRSVSAGESVGEKVVQKGAKASEAKGVGKGKMRDEGDMVGENMGSKNKATGTWYALTNI